MPKNNNNAVIIIKNIFIYILFSTQTVVNTRARHRLGSCGPFSSEAPLPQSPPAGRRGGRAAGAAAAGGGGGGEEEGLKPWHV